MVKNYVLVYETYGEGIFRQVTTKVMAVETEFDKINNWYNVVLARELGVREVVTELVQVDKNDEIRWVNRFPFDGFALYVVEVDNEESVYGKSE